MIRNPKYGVGARSKPASERRRPISRAGSRRLTHPVLAAGSSILLAGCGAAHPTAATPPSSPPDANAPNRSVYRFVPIGGHATTLRLDDAGRLGAIEGARVVVGPDGAMDRASDGGGMGGVPIPARLGGGYLFWSTDTLYRAKAFLGPLDPIARLPSNVIRVRFGHDAVVVWSPLEHGDAPRAYRMDSSGPQRVALSPHGLFDVAGADDDRVVAVDVAGRALASIDGGKTWKDVSAEIKGHVTHLDGSAGEASFEVDDRDLVSLQRDGTLVRSSLPPTHGGPPIGMPIAPELLFYQAVTAGVPLPRDRALLGFRGEAYVVDLASGAAISHWMLDAPTSSCAALAADDDGLVMCSRYRTKGGNTAILYSHVLSGAPRTEGTFGGPTIPAVSRRGVVVTGGPCDPAAAAAAATCMRNGAGPWTQVDVSKALSPKARVEAWIVRDDGGLSALVVTPPSGKGGAEYSLVDGASGEAVAFDTSLASHAPQNAGRTWSVGRDGVLRGFTSTGAVRVDAHGHVTFAAPQFPVNAVKAGDAEHALARDAAHRLWQTVDGGAHWQEIARPRYDVAPDVSATTDPELARALLTIPMGCSTVGCAIGHSSGVGSWLRVGWPLDPPRPGGAIGAPSSGPPAPHAQGAPTPEAPAPHAQGAPTPEAPAPHAQGAPTPEAAPPDPPPALPKLRCTLRGPLEPRSDEHARVAVAATSSRDWQVNLGGRRFLAREGENAFDNVEYRDDTAGAGVGVHLLGGPMRAVVHAPTPAAPSSGVSPPALVKTAIDALFVDPFDPAGRIVRARQTVAFPEPDPTLPRLPRDEASEARPVLSTRPGHADGVILPGTYPLWASASGALHAASVHGHLTAGYADGHGKLWIAVDGPDGSATLVDALTGEVRMRFPRVALYSSRERPRTAVFDGEVPYPRIFANADSVGVDEKGRIGILRVASGSTPASVDDPAWFMTEGEAPVELAPWSTIAPASAPECAHDGAGVRAVVQTYASWIAVDGAHGLRRDPGMSAIVRWSRARVCVEALEVGFAELDEGLGEPLRAMAVVRFVGEGAGAGVVGLGRTMAAREPAACAFE